MDKQPKKGGEDGGFMVRAATFIVDRRNLFFLLFGIALIFSVVSMNWVSVENALSAYLPETTETSQGLDRMEEQFITYGTAKVMVTNIPYDEADRIYEALLELDSIIMLDFDNSKSHYNNFRRCTASRSGTRRRTTGRLRRSTKSGQCSTGTISMCRPRWEMRRQNSWRRRCP